MNSDSSFFLWFLPALFGSSVLGGVLVQHMVHRTRRHLTQNIADLAEAAVKIGDKTVIHQIAQLISQEVDAQSPKPHNRRRRYEAAIVILAVTLCIAMGTVVGAMLYVDDALKSGMMKSDQADIIWMGSLIVGGVLVMISSGYLLYTNHKHNEEIALSVAGTGAASSTSDSAFLC